MSADAGCASATGTGASTGPLAPHDVDAGGVAAAPAPEEEFMVPESVYSSVMEDLPTGLPGKLPEGYSAPGPGV